MEHAELLNRARKEYEAVVKGEGEPLLLFQVDDMMAGILVEQLEEIVDEYDSQYIGDYVKKYFALVEELLEIHYAKYE